MARRSTNFSKCEVDYLMKLVEERKHVLESKKIDRKTCEEKVEAWFEIELEFNKKLGHSHFRNAERLRTKYKNVKKTLKKRGITSDTKLLKPIKKIVGQYDRLIEIDPCYDNYTRETNDIGEDCTESLPSDDTRKSEIHDLDTDYIAEEHNTKMKRQELEMSILEKEHHLKIAKMQLEIYNLEQQLQQMKKQYNNSIYDN